MTAPMPETMSPREKVAAAVRSASRSQWNDGVRVGSAKWCSHLTDAILAALASSGDHAGLAAWFERQGERHRPNAATYRQASAVLPSLIAEVAALRSQHETGMAEVARAGQNLQSQRIAITEAERKLVEADKCARSIVAMEIPPGDDPEQRMKLLSMLARAQVLARTFLSKEAERG